MYLRHYSVLITYVNDMQKKFASIYDIHVLLSFGYNAVTTLAMMETKKCKLMC